ncbi:amidohydrolase family protein [Lichenicoccus sp.]|uniref:amidohydrolase family protein n=1 Tax=Lichenicoccus sp. TaxID=2781899 RepID=UPI003D134172
MRVDVHAHHVPAAYMEMLLQGDGPTFGAPQDDTTLQKMVEAQDTAGIDVQLLSTGPNSPYLRHPELAAAAAREVNNHYRDIVDRYAGRFAAFGSVPLPHTEVAAAEAVRCLDELGFAGIHLGCSVLGRALDDPSFSEMWAELDRREAVIYVHPGGVMMGCEPGLSGMDDAVIAVTIGSAAELATAALRLVALCRTHHRLRVILGLLGGALPSLVQRVSWIAGRWKGPSILSTTDRAGSLIEELQRFSYDTNFLPDPAALAAAQAAFGIDRLLFGSDAPALAPDVTSRFMRQAGLNDLQMAAVLSANPARVFGDRLSRG